MNENEAMDYAASALEMLEIAAMVYETGRTDILEQLGSFAFDYDESYDLAMEGLSLVGDFSREYGHEDSEIVTMYFSSHAMMDYYRLCREYTNLTGVSLKSNPYMKRAESEVREQMDPADCYYCAYWLQTKVNHDWASGIVFKYDCSYFCEFLALFSRLLYVFQFYTNTVTELRKEVEVLKQQQSNGKLLPFPQKPDILRRAT